MQEKINGNILLNKVRIIKNYYPQILATISIDKYKK